jgi:hypothetical protein
MAERLMVLVLRFAITRTWLITVVLVVAAFRVAALYHAWLIKHFEVAALDGLVAAAGSAVSYAVVVATCLVAVALAVIRSGGCGDD